MKAMDWGPAAPFLATGQIGAEEVEGADAFVLVAPQNIVGHSIVPFLGEMVGWAGGRAGGRASVWGRGRVRVRVVNRSVSDGPMEGNGLAEGRGKTG